MSKRSIELPDYIVSEWPEVFTDLHANTLPVEYLEKLKIEFYDGRVWEVAVKSRSDKESLDDFIKKLKAALSEYSEEISKIDYILDTELLKSDIQKNTKNLL